MDSLSIALRNAAKDGVKLYCRDAEIIVENYLRQQNEKRDKEFEALKKELSKKNYFKKGFAIGYKKGYCHRSDRKYNEALFNMWRKYVALTTEKKSRYASRMEIEGELEIVEPSKNDKL